MTNLSAAAADPIAAILMQVPRETAPHITRLSVAQWQEHLVTGWSSTSKDELIWIESELDIPSAFLPGDAEIVSLRRSATTQVYLLSKDRQFMYRFLEYLRAVAEEYEPEVSRALIATVKPGWICVDVGSHIGRISLLLAELTGPSGKVFSFDALASNAEDLRRLAALKGFSDRIQVTYSAVTDGSSPSVMLYPGRGESSAEWNLRGQDVEGNSTAAKFSVPATSLDAALGEMPVDLVKIDVEGCAAGVFKGMMNLFQRRQPVFLIEFHSPEECEAARFLHEAGYIVTELSTGVAVKPGAEGYQCLCVPPRLQA